jgi:hypothetical protein
MEPGVGRRAALPRNIIGANTLAEMAAAAGSQIGLNLKSIPESKVASDSKLHCNTFTAKRRSW